MTTLDLPPLPAPTRPSRLRRALLWGALVALLGVAQSLLVLLTLKFEASRAQDEADAVAGEVAGELRRDLLGMAQTLQALGWAVDAGAGPHAEAEALLRSRRELQRLEWRAPDLGVTEAVDSPYLPSLFSRLPRQDLSVDAELACSAARRTAAPSYSRSYFVPRQGGLGLEIIDLCLPLKQAGRERGFLVASFSLADLLETALAERNLRGHEFSFVEGDGTRLARAGVPRGAGVYVAERVLDLPGNTLQLRADSSRGHPSLIPNLATALVLGLSMALFGLLLLLARDVRRRAKAEAALAEALAFRKAMEDSLSTGLRARDLGGAITYVNPAFCAMVGFSAEQLLTQPTAADGRRAEVTPPYWPPEFVEHYRQRQRQRLEDEGRDPREGHETVFMRSSGERFPVMIYEAPLVDGAGRHTGWMSAVVDLSAQRRVEEISRQQQDRLQAAARLATVGEMASLLSHELNQPLAAIASYASGSLNLLDDEGPDAQPLGGTGREGLRQMLHQALERIAEQAERAGRVIKSVHDFVRRREQLHETLPAERLLEAVLPLARMQAGKSGVRIDIDLAAAVPAAAEGVAAPVADGGAAARPATDGAAAPVPGSRAPRVRCDRTMVEQVLLNLTRNAIQAMESGTPAGERVLTLRVRQHHPRWVTLSVIDTGPGIPPEVARQLFMPFFTTKPEGMGLGLSLCRTVIEQHGGTLDHGPGPGGRGTEFRFTLPAPPATDATASEGTAATR